MQIKLIISLVLALILVLFAIQNPTPVKIKFLTWQTADMSLIVVIIASALIGALLATVLGLIKQAELKGKIKQKEEELKKFDKNSGRVEGPDF